MRTWILGFLFCIVVTWQANAIVHEAYLPAVTDCLPLKPIKNKPPKNKTEVIPNQSDASRLWIPGYWHWDSKKKDFTWVKGLWRRPPSSHYWIPGYWHSHKNHWVYINGFWSPVPLHELVYLPLPPLKAEEESCECPGENYCWRAGYWSYDPDVEDYQWVSGEWILYDPDWIVVPTHYRWYQKGYVCILSFSDWSFDKRGESYSCHELAKQLLPCYPDYLYFYQYYLQTYPRFVDTYEWAPQWWRIPNCWSYTWNDHWNTWWGYTHQNYSGACGLSEIVDDSLKGPVESLVSCMQDYDGPLFIGEQSPCSYNSLFDTCEWTNECSYPPVFFGLDTSYDQYSSRVERQDYRNARRGLYSSQAFDTCDDEIFALQWYYFSNRFYYRRLGLWFSFCQSYHSSIFSCNTCQSCENPCLEQLGRERQLISNRALEQESQRVERARFLSILSRYGPLDTRY
jgi:hypothetical protein